MPDTITIGRELTVRRIGLGTNRLRNAAHGRAFVRRAVELGVNLIDTADIYTGQESEQTIGDALTPPPAGLVVATKGGMTRGGAGGTGVNASEAYLRGAVEASLRRLKRERIDLYYLHRLDPRVPIAESMGALRAMQEAGFIRHIGLSSVSVAQIDEARRHVAIAAVQNHYNVAERQHEVVLRWCEREGVAFVAYYPLSPARRGRPPRALEALMQKHQASAHQLALAWLLHHSPALVPIPGTTSEAHLAENLGALRITLSAGDCEELERAFG